MQLADSKHIIFVRTIGISYSDSHMLLLTEESSLVVLCSLLKMMIAMALTYNFYQARVLSPLIPQVAPSYVIRVQEFKSFVEPVPGAAPGSD